MVAQRLGFNEDEALTLGKAVAALNAVSKRQHLGIFKPHEQKPKEARAKERGEPFSIEIMHRAVPVVVTEDGIRAVQGGKPISPDSVRRYLAGKLDENLEAARSAMQKLAKAYKPEELAHSAYKLYKRFRPAIPEGVRGWGVKGELDLTAIEELANERG